MQSTSSPPPIVKFEIDAASLARWQREWEAERRKREVKAVSAIKRYSGAKNELHRRNALKAIEHCSLFAGSARRLSTVLSLIDSAPPQIFWPAFMESWSSCDATWPHKARLLRVLQAMGPPNTYFSTQQHAFFDLLPPKIDVFRGCSRPRVRAVAWTTDATVAEGFAKGHRSLRVPEAVIASAVVRKEDIFFVMNNRNEKEVVLNPRRLQRLVIQAYVVAAARAAKSFASVI